MESSVQFLYPLELKCDRISAVQEAKTLNPKAPQLRPKRDSTDGRERSMKSSKLNKILVNLSSLYLIYLMRSNIINHCSFSMIIKYITDSCRTVKAYASKNRMHIGE